MKKFIFTLAIIKILLFCISSCTQSEAPVDFSSTKVFFRMADEIAAGTVPTEQEWTDLFETEGSKIGIAETFDERGIFIRKAMNLAFNPEKVNERDSVMSIPVAEIVSDMDALLLSRLSNL